MQITKREILLSVSIIAIMLVIGVLISGKISEVQMDSNEKYNKATTIESTELFRYGMDTSIGNSFVYGDLKAVDPVTYPEIGGQYLSVTKIKERYTMHTRVVTSTDSKGKTTSKTETYWTWDEVNRERINSNKIMFCGVEFQYSQLNKQEEHFVITIKESSHVRYKYYGCKSELKGTMFAYLMDGNIGESGAVFYNNKTINETLECLTSGHGLIVFWIFWITLIGFAVYLFYVLENRWLE